MSLVCVFQGVADLSVEPVDGLVAKDLGHSNAPGTSASEAPGTSASEALDTSASIANEARIQRNCI